jgi:hypothetical protein
MTWHRVPTRKRTRGSMSRSQACSTQTTARAPRAPHGLEMAGLVRLVLRRALSRVLREALRVAGPCSEGP